MFGIDSGGHRLMKETKHDCRYLISWAPGLMAGFFLITMMGLLLGCGEPGPLSVTMDIADSGAGTYIYPEKDWPAMSPEQLGMSTKGLQDLEDYLSRFMPMSFIVIRKGYIVWEKYWDNIDENTPFEWFSATKSVTSALAGVAVSQGFFTLDQPAWEFIESWQPPDPRSAIQIQHLLTMTSGLHGFWDEYAYVVYSLLLGMGQKNLLQHSVNLPLDHQPGTQWYYNNCGLMTMSQVLRKATGSNPFDYARENLFEPIGLHPAEWVGDSRGNTYTFMGLRATALDMARLGYLFLRQGKWRGETVIPKEWVELTTRVHDPEQNPAYGHLWWVNGYADSWPPMGGMPFFYMAESSHYFTEELSTNVYAALGFLGQILAILPDEEIILVRNCLSESASTNKIFTLLAHSIVSD